MRDGLVLPSAQCRQVTIPLICVGRGYFQSSEGIFSQCRKQPHVFGGIQFVDQILVWFVIGHITCPMPTVVTDIERLVSIGRRCDVARGVGVVTIVAARQFDVREQFCS